MEKKSIIKIVRSSLGGIIRSFKNLGRNTIMTITTMLGINSMEINNEEVIPNEDLTSVETTNLNIIQTFKQFGKDLKDVAIEFKNSIKDYFTNADINASVSFNDINVKANNKGITIGLEPAL